MIHRTFCLPSTGNVNEVFGAPSPGYLSDRGSEVTMAKILLVDDDLDLLDTVSTRLRFERHLVETTDDPESGWELMQLHQFDLIILDWSMPVLDGIELCRRFRKSGGSTPVLLLTARETVEEKVIGFEAGADDYLGKTADHRELSARVKALLRRSLERVEDIITIRGFSLDSIRHSVTKNGTPVSLLPREFSLLEFLMKNPNRVYSAQDLIDRLWTSESDVSPHTVTTCVNRLRSKLGETTKDQSLIKTIYSVGYTIET
jgi:DNA-binding response OmpR family regulator